MILMVIKHSGESGKTERCVDRCFGILWSVMLCFGNLGLIEKLLKNMRESCSSFLMHELLHPEYEITHDLE